jgi:hypothetical protein
MKWLQALVAPLCATMAVVSWHSSAICGLAWEMPLMWTVMAVAHFDSLRAIFKQ